MLALKLANIQPVSTNFLKIDVFYAGALFFQSKNWSKQLIFKSITGLLCFGFIANLCVEGHTHISV
jgi:hypothetical protein